MCANICLDLIRFNADEPEDYYDSNYDSKMKLSTILLSYITEVRKLYCVSIEVDFAFELE